MSETETAAAFSKPDTAAEALARWDKGENVFTAEMGGLGPGYEQVIHIIAFEIIRELLSREFDRDVWERALGGDEDARVAWRLTCDDVEKAVQPKIAGLGCSGAQFGAAQNLAYIVVRKGWAKALSELPADRLIQVSRDWPASPKVA